MKRKLDNATLPRAKKANLGHSNSNNTNVTSLSDDEDSNEEEDKLTLLTETQQQELITNGYCMMEDPLTNHQIVSIVQGYIRNNVSAKYMIRVLIRTIVNYYHSRYNSDLYIELICTDFEGDCNTKEKAYETFLVPKRNITLSTLLSARMDCAGNKIEIDKKKLSTEHMHHVLRYLGHHKGIKPAKVEQPIRSIHMQQILTDKWDAQYIDAFTKKTVFELILVANYLGCASLVNLGCLKIATLIKQSDQAEINRIIEEEGKHRREHP